MILVTTASVPSGAQGLVNEAFTIASFDASLFLFVELIEERDSPLEGGQTTSFAGDFSVYRYDEGKGTIEDEMTFPIDEALRMVVGRILTVRIGDNVAFNGQLYGYPFQDLAFLPVAFTSLESGGRLCFIYEEDESCLDPGASITFPTTEKATLTIINHGFLNKSDLIDVR